MYFGKDISGFRNIPVDELRDHLDEPEKDLLTPTSYDTRETIREISIENGGRTMKKVLYEELLPEELVQRV